MVRNNVGDGAGRTHARGCCMLGWLCVQLACVTTINK
jgi:hypothetical protein